MTEPLSPRNPRVKRLGLLAHKSAARAEQQAFVIEGATLVAEAVAAGVVVEAVFVEEQALVGLDVDAFGDAEVLMVMGRGLRGVVDTLHPQPVAAIAALPATFEPATLADRADLLLAAAAVSDPGNVGTILRTAEAAGVGGVLLGRGTADPFAPKVVRASAGAVFRLPLALRVDLVAALEDLGERRFCRLAAAASGQTPYDEVDLIGPSVFVLGSEAHGLESLGPDVDRLVDRHVAIPMMGGTESLNVAVAGAILCFEAARQRRTGKATG